MPTTEHIDMSQVNRFMKELRQMEPDAAKELRNNFRSLANEVASNARTRASAWSKTGKMANSIKPRVDSRGNAAIASSHPGLPINEFGGRHPVFGNSNAWVRQAPRPTMLPAVEAAGGRFEQRALQAIDEAARKAGFR